MRSRKTQPEDRTDKNQQNDITEQQQVAKRAAASVGYANVVMPVKFVKLIYQLGKHAPDKNLLVCLVPRRSKVASGKEQGALTVIAFFGVAGVHDSYEAIDNVTANQAQQGIQFRVAMVL
jgi:hypothetical protein